MDIVHLLVWYRKKEEK
uniref:Uncharacterized protein n=1 Tax=Rhizophora mucronata TaxID=61149 RepID=A0A2P2P200_RHIMU